ncbi:hypothetical protein OsI_26002 [Oryza sativa Indica Group]|uniref:Uncharacterized protein n=1 Tax=Oryza sativa subsp. indica TaxID=39946 RepID=A2YLA6_ORYSI|nr:hypothetical protein OsI_26002 [Oryza sativa Indica Group]
MAWWGFLSKRRCGWGVPVPLDPEWRRSGGGGASGVDEVGPTPSPNRGPSNPDLASPAWEARSLVSVGSRWWSAGVSMTVTAGNDYEGRFNPAFRILGECNYCKHNHRDTDLSRNCAANWWKQHHVEAQGKRNHQASSRVYHQAICRIETSEASFEDVSRHPSKEQEGHSNEKADKCQGIGEDKRIENVAPTPSKQRRASGTTIVASWMIGSLRAT